MSLKDGLKKMSKSDPSDQSRINLTDSADVIVKKIQKAKTDSDPFPLNHDQLTNRPEIKNLINIYSTMTDLSVDEIIKKFNEKDFKIFKNELSDVLVDKISKISVEMKKLLTDNIYLDSILKNGCEKAEKIANKNIRDLKSLIGFFGV